MRACMQDRRGKEKADHIYCIASHCIAYLPKSKLRRHLRASEKGRRAGGARRENSSGVAWVTGRGEGGERCQERLVVTSGGGCSLFPRERRRPARFSCRMDRSIDGSPPGPRARARSNSSFPPSRGYCQ